MAFDNVAIVVVLLPHEPSHVPLQAAYMPIRQFVQGPHPCNNFDCLEFVSLFPDGLMGMLTCRCIQVEANAFAPLGLGPDVVTPSRAINFANLLETARKRVLTLVEQPPRFPSLVISADSLEPQGDFAKAQAQYLMPNAAQVDRLVKVSLVEPTLVKHKDLRLSSFCIRRLSNLDCCLQFTTMHFPLSGIEAAMSLQMHCSWLVSLALLVLREHCLWNMLLSMICRCLHCVPPHV